MISLYHYKKTKVDPKSLKTITQKDSLLSTYVVKYYDQYVYNGLPKGLTSQCALHRSVGV